MDDYLFYTYFEDGRGYFVYKDLTFERSHKKEKDFPFLESLLRFTYLDIWPMDSLFKEMDKALLNFYQERDADSRGIVMNTLERLAKEHIYFEFLRLDWQSRSAMRSTILMMFKRFSPTSSCGTSPAT